MAETKQVVPTIYNDLLLVLEGYKIARDCPCTQTDRPRHDGSDEVLDFATKPKAKTLRTRLTHSDYDGLSAVTAHLEEIKTVLERDETQDPLALRQAERLHEFAAELIELEQHRAFKGDANAQPESHEVGKGQPGRKAQVKALFMSTISGPMFTSCATTTTEQGTPDLPLGLQVAQVLPVPPSNVRLLGDLQQGSMADEQRTPLDARSQRLLTDKRIKTGNYESFGLVLDRADAVNSLEDSLPYLFETPDMQQIPDTSSNLSVAAAASHDTKMQEETFELDEELLNAYEPDLDAEDSTSLILRLSEAQEARLCHSPFAEVSAEEQDLASRIFERLQSQILDSGLKPRDLLSTGVRQGFTFAKYTTSYHGSLPPTVSQMVAATCVQNRQLPHLHPLENHRPMTPAKQVTRPAGQAFTPIVGAPSPLAGATTETPPVVTTPVPTSVSVAVPVPAPATGPAP